MVAYHSEAAIQIKGVYYYAGYSVDETSTRSIWVRCSDFKIYGCSKGEILAYDSDNVTRPVEYIISPIRPASQEEKKKYAFQLLTKLKDRSGIRVKEARRKWARKADDLLVLPSKLLSWSAVVLQRD